MERFTVHIPDRVRKEILVPVPSIAERSIEHALAWETRLTNAIRQTGDHPGFARKELISHAPGKVTRRMVFERINRVFHRVHEDRNVEETLHFDRSARPSAGEGGT